MVPASNRLAAGFVLSVILVLGCASEWPPPLPRVVPRHPFQPSSDAEFHAPSEAWAFGLLTHLGDEDVVLRQAFEVFRTAERVECDFIGEGGVPSDQYLATRILLDRADAPELVAWLMSHATLEGRVAILNAAACTHPRAAVAALEAIRTTYGGERIDTICGCTGDSPLLADVLDRSLACPLDEHASREAVGASGSHRNSLPGRAAKARESNEASR